MYGFVFVRKSERGDNTELGHWAPNSPIMTIEERVDAGFPKGKHVEIRTIGFVRWISNSLKSEVCHVQIQLKSTE